MVEVGQGIERLYKEADAAEAASTRFRRSMDDDCLCVGRCPGAGAVAIDRALDFKGAGVNGWRHDEAGRRRREDRDPRPRPQGRDRGDGRRGRSVREQHDRGCPAARRARSRPEQLQAEQRKADMRRLADSFEGAVGEIVETVSSAATELEASANTLTIAAERSQTSSPPRLPAASEEASTNVQSVASRQRGDDFLGQRDQPAGAGIVPRGQRSGRSGRRRPTIGSANCRRRRAASAMSSS